MTKIHASPSSCARFATGRSARAVALTCAASLLSGVGIENALAQAGDDTLGEIVVTARKRQESILKVPVVVTAVSEEQLDNFQLTQITDLPKLVPGLVLAGNLLSIGPQVTIRGVGTSSYDPGVDQSVSLNIDGLSLGQGLAFASGMFDVAQVEVLKGPQALFYGKSSPGGVISLRTADPTDEREVIGRAGYEFEGREQHAELIVSGPLSETLGGRLSASYTRGDGWFENDAEPVESTGAEEPHSREPRPRDYLLRGTLLWKPVEAFAARFKINHTYAKSVDPELAQLANCPDGEQMFGFGGFGPALGLSPVDPIPFIGGDDCKLNRDIGVVYMNPQFFPGITNDGVPYLKNQQDYGTLELSFDISPALTLTSATAYYDLDSSSLANPTHTTAAAPTFAAVNTFERRELTQELRLNSDFSGPLNFTLGGFVEDGRIFDRVSFIRNIGYGFLSPAIVGSDILNDDRSTEVDIETVSIFGQLRYRMIEQLEVAAGVRWTDEERKESVFDYQSSTDLTPTLPRPKVQSDNYSPELTLTYTPTDDLTVFGSYKKGYKSGSFKMAVPAVAGEDNSFDDEKVEGYEIGLKSLLFDRALLLNLAFYDYEYKGLQVGSIEPAPGGVPVIRTVNAGEARTYGVDLDLAYRPPIAGLTLNASINWNNAEYEELTKIGCYANQTISQGCTLNPDPFRLDPDTGLPLFTTQDLSNTPMIRAPKWAVNAGLQYELPVSADWKLQFTSNNQYSSEYVTFPAVGRPNKDNWQDGFFKTDAGAALQAVDDRWEVALIGKNLTNEITASNCSATNFAGGLVLGTDNYGGTAPGTVGQAETGCFADGPGRQYWLRLTYRPFAER